MSSKLKIGFVLDDGLDSTDGVQQYITTLGQWLSAQGHNVHYLVGETLCTDIPNLHSLSRNIRVAFNQNKLSMPLPANKQAIKALLEREKFDVLHVQMPHSPFLAGRIMLAASESTAVIGTFHVLLASRVAEFATKALGLLERRSLQRIDALISVSEPAQALAKQTLGLASQVIPNAVDVATFTHGKKLPMYDDDKTNVLFLGRLVKRKGAEHAIRAFAKANLAPTARLIIGGKGDKLQSLQMLAKDLQVADAVTFAGFIGETNKANFLASADIAVFPSTGGESFGIVLVEAMAAGAGVVLAGDNPGYATVMQHNKEVLVNPTDIKQFAAKLRELNEQPQKRQELRAWQQQITTQYDVVNVGPQILTVYNEVLSSKAKVG